MPFCGEAEVVESRYYKHPESGREFSLFSSYVEPGSELLTRGWTIRWSGDGTVGTCKPAFKTKAEADDYAARWNDKRAAAIAANRESN